MDLTRRSLRWIAIGLAGVLVAVAAVAAFPSGRNLLSRALGGEQAPDGSQPQPITTADLSGDGPGSLVTAVSMPNFSRTGYGRYSQAARVEYRSTNGDTGAETVVSGAVFAPEGAPPAGGWPVIALGHGTSGIDQACAPSLSASLLTLAEPVSAFVKQGYAVALADYQGLGAPGEHPYMDARTAGLNMIDSVRALRHTFTGVSDRWLAFGGSQGGGAAWAADEEASGYAPELTLVGAVANSPAADVSGLIDKARDGTLTEDQIPGFQALIESLARSHPEIDRDDYRRGAAAQYWDILSSCSGMDVHDRASAVKLLKKGDLAPDTPAAADRVRRILQRWALPHRTLSAPLSVIYGADDTYIDSQWTTEAITRACRLGGTIDYEMQPAKGHGDIDIESQFAWLADRFAGKEASNACP